VRAAGVLGTALAALLAGCGATLKSLPPACSEGPQAVLRALRAAPGRVRLSDGTRLSECITRAYQDGEVQQLGYALTPAADRLARAATPAAALQLGFLVGAVRRGAGQTNGVQIELVRRLESTITFSDPALVAAAVSGERAGEAGG
jgi:hypothetical protein